MPRRRNQPFDDLYVVDADGCWLWIGRLDERGYGRFGSGQLAHVYSYKKHVGDVPSGRELDHLCRVKRCVRPSHLEAVPHIVNVRRGDRTKRPGVLRQPVPAKPRKTHCRNGHELNAETAYVRPDNGGRQCRLCGREAVRRADAKRRANFRASR